MKAAFLFKETDNISVPILFYCLGYSRNNIFAIENDILKNQENS